MKPVIAASVLDLDPDKKNFIYDCTEENHVFQTEGGAFRIDCSGVHGQMNMENAMAVSCNGYFISLLQSVDKKSLSIRSLSMPTRSSLQGLLQRVMTT